MVHYRRSLVQGGTFFFTVCLQDRRGTKLVDNIDALREALRRTLRHRPFVVDALVVLPDHMHTLWTLPSGDVDYAGRWRLLKSCFTKALVRAGAELARNARGDYGLWQRRYWEHTIRDEADLERHVDYIHFNPVKHGLVERVGDWPYSTFHRYVRGGLYPPDWAGRNMKPDTRCYGE